LEVPASSTGSCPIARSRAATSASSTGEVHIVNADGIKRLNREANHFVALRRSAREYPPIRPAQR
jgi:hypothetical protein